VLPDRTKATLAPILILKGDALLCTDGRPDLQGGFPVVGDLPSVGEPPAKAAGEPESVSCAECELVFQPTEGMDETVPWRGDKTPPELFGLAPIAGEGNVFFPGLSRTVPAFVDS
jgi:hypothetical protein